MASRYRPFWNRIFRAKLNWRPVMAASRSALGRGSLPGRAVALSLFTWLGFDKRVTVEDELTMSIRHCVLFVERGEYEKAEQLLHVALRQAQQLQNELAVTYIYDVMANLALVRRQLDAARRLFVAVTQRVLAEGAGEEDSRVIHLSIKLARISHLQGDHQTAQLGYEWCLDKLRTEELSPGVRRLIALTEDWYGRLFIDCKQYEQGIKLLLSALNHMRELDMEPEHVATQLNDIGTFYNQMGRVDDSIQYFTEAINIARQTKNMDETGTFYVNLGRVFLKKNLLDLARKHCGFGWRLGNVAKNEDIVREAESCMKEIKDAAG